MRQAIDRRGAAQPLRRRPRPSAQSGATVSPPQPNSRPEHRQMVVDRPREAIESPGARIVNLRPYIPEFYPIALLFSKLKRLLRRDVARTATELWGLLGKLVPVFTSQKYARYLKYCGYRNAATTLSEAVQLSVKKPFTRFFHFGNTRKRRGFSGAPIAASCGGRFICGLLYPPATLDRFPQKSTEGKRPPRGRFNPP